MIRRKSMFSAVPALLVLSLLLLSDYGIAKSSLQEKDTAKEGATQSTSKTQKTKPTDPFTIQKLSLKDNKIHVTVQAAAGVDVSSGKYKIIKLKIEPQLGKGKQEWSISEVYDKGTPTIRAGEVAFNTGLTLKKQQLITAKLYGGGWQTARRERLGMALAQKSVSLAENQEQGVPKGRPKPHGPGSSEYDAADAPYEDDTASSMARPRSRGIVILRPVPGTRTHVGGTIELHWQFTDDVRDYCPAPSEVAIRLWSADLTSVYGTPLHTSEHLLSYPIDARLSPGDYMISITPRGDNIPEVDPTVLIWAKSNIFRVLPAE